MLKRIKSKAFWKQVLRVTLWVAFSAAFLFSLGFSDIYQSDVRCKALYINVDNGESNFVDKEDVRQILKEKGDTIIQVPVRNVDVPRLEKLLNTHPCVENAEVYASLNGIVKIDIEQRTPVVRIINWSGESYYIDSKGKMMPLSDKYTSRVLVVNGYLNEPYAKRYKYSIPDILRYPDIMQKTWLDDIFTLAIFLKKDPFWKSQIQQVFINRENEMELVPRIGNHRIILGNISDMEEKFMKLKIFYTEGLNKTNSWNKYSVINLNFKNQIVCTKK